MSEPFIRRRGISIAVPLLACLVAFAAAVPLLDHGGAGPTTHTSVRGEEVAIHGLGPYRHMPADVAVQGLAQDLVTLAIALPVLLVAFVLARRGSRAAYVVVTGAVGYLFVQYFLYLGMATYNELFLVWVAIVLVSFQTLARLLLADAPGAFVATSTRARRRYVGGFLVVNGTLIALLWLQVIVPPLLDGTLYPPGLAHLTTMFVQAFDLALFLPPSLIAGVAYWRGRPHGEVLAPVYAVFLSLQMTALLAKIIWMNAIGVSAGPALVIIPVLLIGAFVAAALALAPNRRAARPGAALATGPMHAT
jgi:hypothetical protein